MTSNYRESDGPGILNFPRSVPSRAQPRLRSFQSILNRGWTSSTHAQYHLLDFGCLNIHLAHRPRGLKKLPARGRGARLSASPPDADGRSILWPLESRRILCIRIRGGTVHRCHGSVHTSVRGSRFDTILVQHEKKNLLCLVSFHLF